MKSFYMLAGYIDDFTFDMLRQMLLVRWRLERKQVTNKFPLLKYNTILEYK